MISKPFLTFKVNELRYKLCGVTPDFSKSIQKKYWDKKNISKNYWLKKVNIDTINLEKFKQLKYIIVNITA